MSNILKTVTTRVERPASRALIIGASFLNKANTGRPRVDHVFNQDLPPDLVVPLASLRLAGWSIKDWDAEAWKNGSKMPYQTLSIEVTPEEFERITTYEKAARAKRLAAEAAATQNAPTQNALPTHEEIPY